jgi:hypothetical protein
MREPITRRGKHISFYIKHEENHTNKIESLSGSAVFQCSELSVAECALMVESISGADPCL